MEMKFRLPWREYFSILSRVVKDPKSFYLENAGESDWVKPAGVLLISSLVFTLITAVMAMPRTSLLMTGIYFVNAVGMVLITSALGYLVACLTQGTGVSYGKIFGIYAYASGAVLVLAWMPFMLWIAEIWRWWIIGCGLKNGCGYATKDTLLIITLSLLTLILGFWGISFLLTS